MNPLSHKKRTALFYIFSIIFVLAIPIVILYSIGYRLQGLKNLTSTGGIYIEIDSPGATVFLDGEMVRRTNIIQKSMFIQNLKEGEYKIKVAKNNFWEWQKNIEVVSEKVTEIKPFLLPRMVNIQKINKYAGVATTSSKINPEYEVVSKNILKNEETESPKNIDLSSTGNMVEIEWTGSYGSLPYYFCEKFDCKRKINVNFHSNVRKVDFYPDREDVLIVALSDGIFASDISESEQKNIIPVFLGKDLEFYIDDDQIIFIKDKESIYRLNIQF